MAAGAGILGQVIDKIVMVGCPCHPQLSKNYEKEPTPRAKAQSAPHWQLCPDWQQKPPEPGMGTHVAKGGVQLACRHHVAPMVVWALAPGFRFSRAAPSRPKYINGRPVLLWLRGHNHRSSQWRYVHRPMPKRRYHFRSTVFGWRYK